MMLRASIVAGAVLASMIPATAQTPAGKVAAQTTQPTKPAVQPAQQAAKPADSGAELTTATFGDWQLRCRSAVPAAGTQAATPRACEVVQTVILQGQTAPFAQLAFGKTAPSEPMQLTTVLPTNVAFPSTVKIATDEKDKHPVELAWTRCIPGGCFASTAAKDEFLKRWRATEEAGRFTFKNSAGQEMTLPFSFRGLARALDALAKEG